MLPLTLPPAVVHLLALGAAQVANFATHRAFAVLAQPFLISFVEGIQTHLTTFVNQFIFQGFGPRIDHQLFKI